MKVLRIIFCILACLCVAAVVPVAIFFEWFCLIPAAGAFLFGGGMFFLRSLMAPPPPRTTFLDPDETEKK